MAAVSCGTSHVINSTVSTPLWWTIKKRMCCERIVTHSEPHATWAQWVCLRAVNITIWKRPITIIYATQSIPTEHSPLSSSTTDCPNGRGNFPCFTNRSLPQTSHIGLWQPSSNHIPDWVCYTSLKTSNHSPDWVCYTSLKTSNHSSNWVCYTSLKTSNHIPDWVCYTTHLWKLPTTALTGYAAHLWKFWTTAPTGYATHLWELPTAALTGYATRLWKLWTTALTGYATRLWKLSADNFSLVLKWQ